MNDPDLIALVALHVEGDQVGTMMLRDYCEERGLPMTSIEIGKSYYIRTLTWHYTGRVVAVTPLEIVLEDAAWVPDQGRMYDALKTGQLNEVEPFPDGVAINRNHVTDVAPWNHDLARSQV